MSRVYKCRYCGELSSKPIKDNEDEPPKIDRYGNRYYSYTCYNCLLEFFGEGLDDI